MGTPLCTAELIETIEFVRSTVPPYVNGFDCARADARHRVYCNPYAAGTVDHRQYTRGFEDGMETSTVWDDSNLA